MIVRTWHGCVPEALGEAFAEHLRKTGEDHARGVPGNLGGGAAHELSRLGALFLCHLVGFA